LRREDEAVAGAKPIKRIRAEAIADEEQRARLLVEDCGDERALQQPAELVLVNAVERGDGRRIGCRLRPSRLLDIGLQLADVDELAVKEHTHGSVAGELRLGLEDAEMDAAERPAFLYVFARFGNHAAATIHGAEHGVERTADRRTVAATDDSEQTWH